MPCERLKTCLVAFILVAIACGTSALAADISTRDAIEVLRADLKVDRKAMIAEYMQLTEKESEAFWPIYRNYRAEMETRTDRIVELVLEYADVYPDVPEKKASEFLNQYLKVESQLLSVKRKYFKKLQKVLPPSKVFRFAQLDNRYDLGTRVGLAASIPLISTPRPHSTTDQH